MLAYIVLLLAALSRFFPHAFHGVGLNITAVGGGLLFFGARQSRRHVLAGAAIMAATDVVLTRFVYGYPFHVSAYAITWCWYAAVCLVGSGLLHRVTPLRVVSAVFASATGFFLLSNFAVWVGGGLYPHTASGLLACFVAALPFYGNDLVSTGLTAGVLFGLPVAAARLVDGVQGVRGGQPLA